MIDLRSDTVTVPTPDMRRVLSKAEVGDDAYGEDKSVNNLQDYCKDLFQVEDALFVTSGMLANRLAMLTQTSPGDEVVTDYSYHINFFDSAAAAAICHVVFNTRNSDQGILTVEEVQKAFHSKPRYHHFAQIKLVSIENTINGYAGKIFPFEEIKKLRTYTTQKNILLHLDGARLFNAHIETKIPLHDYARQVDTLSVCFSKGLGAPFGSMLMGKKEIIEKAVFLPSGTMCNGIAYRVLCKKPGDLIILDKTAHPLYKSAGLIGGLAHAVIHRVEGERGIFSPLQIEPIVTCKKGYNLSFPRVVSIEQTTNFGGGAIWPFQTLKGVCDLAHRHQVYTHLDGARLLNAVVETNIPASHYAQFFDSVWIDFSKSLGAPIGAVLAGSKEFIEEAWYYKFQQGGGMHKAGILAAACLYALDHNVEKLKEVNSKAKRLALLLNGLPFIVINPDHTETNIVCFEINHLVLNAYDFENLLKEKGIRVLALNQKVIRVITHLDISEADINEVYQTIEAVN